MSTRPTALISGAGIGGPTLAYWLARHGFRVTVVERANGQRSSGSPIDVRGQAIEVVRQMGVLPALQAAQTTNGEWRMVDAPGRTVGRVDVATLQRWSGTEDLELPRGSLAAVLEGASRGSAEQVFGDSIASLDQDASGVDVTFERGTPRRFDLVIGADGLHSMVRRLAFGPESHFVEHIGLHVATLPLPGFDVPSHQVVMYGEPGRLLAVHPCQASPLAAFIFHHPTVADFDHRDPAHHRRVVMETYRGSGWRTDEVLARLEASDDLYYDAVCRVRLPRWSTGRIALLGDAASCVSLFGDGSTLAIEGAFALARALADAPADPAAAFARYEEIHRKRVEPKLRGVALGASLVVPRTRTGLALRNLATRLWPLAGAIGWVRKQFRPRRR